MSSVEVHSQDGVTFMKYGKIVCANFVSTYIPSGKSASTVLFTISDARFRPSTGNVTFRDAQDQEKYVIDTSGNFKNQNAITSDKYPRGTVIYITQN